MLEFRTQGFNGFAVKYSPFFDSRIAVASAANFGIVGNGRLYVLGLNPNGITAEKWFDTQDALYDVAWSETHENQVLVAAGDGSIRLFDITLNEFPVQSWEEHKREVYAVHWNLIRKDIFCSSSWDGTVKIWTPARDFSIVTLPIHSCTYSAAFSPHDSLTLSAVSSDSQLRLFDLRTPSSASNHLTLTIPLHSSQPSSLQQYPPSEALTQDWNKYRPTIIAAAGVDRVIRTFDIRAPAQGPLVILQGHDYPIRKIAWSPHNGHMLLSASYDMSSRVWTDGSETDDISATSVSGGEGGGGGGGKQLGEMDKHTEFVMGVDWCMFGQPGWCASCGWDERVLIWDVNSSMPNSG